MLPNLFGSWQKMSTENSRFEQLDSLRGLAALGVVTLHYQNHFRATPFYAVLRPFYMHGEFLVDFFFVLSGFVLTHAYWREGRRAAIGANIRQRIARIYPLHFVTLMLVAFMQWALVSKLGAQPFVYAENTLHNFVMNLVLMQHTGLETALSFNGPSWSISTEFVVNAVFLAIIALPRKIAMGCFAVLYVMSAAFIMNGGLLHPAAVAGIDGEMFRTVIGFLAGVALYTILKRVALRPVAADFLGGASLAAFLVYCVSGKQWDYAIATTCFPALIVAAIFGNRFRRVLEWRPLLWLGAISYSIYLIHYPLQLALHVASVMVGISVPYERPAVFMAFMVAVVAVAGLTHRTIEVPGKRLFMSQLGKPVLPAAVE